jgi:hypothetical protein
LPLQQGRPAARSAAKMRRDRLVLAVLGLLAVRGASASTHLVNVNVSGTAAGSVAAAFDLHFGVVKTDVDKRAIVKAQLDHFLSLPAISTKERLSTIHDFEDARAAKLASAIVEQLTPNNVDGWARGIQKALPKLSETQGLPVLRRLAVASLLRLWIKENFTLPGDPKMLQDVMVQVRPCFRSGEAHH